MLPTNSNNTKAYKQQRDWLDYATFFVSSITLVFLIVYTLINYCLLRTNRDLIVATNAAFFTKEVINYIVDTGQVIITFTNGGRTSAKKVTGDARLVWKDATGKIVFDKTVRFEPQVIIPPKSVPELCGPCDPDF
jgi:hypothetical protein